MTRMSFNEPVTEWIEQLKRGDSEAAEKLWRRFFQQLVEQARRRLEGADRAVTDEEDVALSAFKSLCLGARCGRFPRLSDRDSLWPLLVAITTHKAVDTMRRQNRKKRGGQGVRLSGTDDERPWRRQAVPLSEIFQDQATPEFAAQLGEQFQLLMDKLEAADDPDLAKIAIAKMQGDSTVEVARQLGCVRRTVERKIVLIRGIWENECQ